MLHEEFQLPYKDDFMQSAAPILEMRYFPLPAALNKYGIPFEVAVHRPHELLVTAVGCIHVVLNIGFVVGVAWNVFPPVPHVLQTVMEEENIVQKVWRIKNSTQHRRRYQVFELKTEPLVNVQLILSRVRNYLFICQSHCDIVFLLTRRN